jgi:hypothetical protein
MATAGFIVDMDNSGDSDPSTPTLMLPYSAVLHPFLAPVVSSVATAQKPRSRQGATRVNPLQTTHGYSRRATYVRATRSGLAAHSAGCAGANGLASSGNHVASEERIVRSTRSAIVLAKFFAPSSVGTTLRLRLERCCSRHHDGRSSNARC